MSGDCWSNPQNAKDQKGKAKGKGKKGKGKGKKGKGKGVNCLEEQEWPSEEVQTQE
jgi:hypothetical protein